VDLIDSQSRKTAVSDRLLQAARLGNARSITSRAEDWARVPPPLGGREAYDAVTARALAPLAVLAEYASPLLAGGGVLVAWKGARDEHEERAAQAAAERLGMQVVEVRRVQPLEAARQTDLGRFAELTDSERAAQRVHKVSYDVALEAPPFRVIGTVFLHPGSEPDRLLDRSTEMFVPVVDAVAMLGEQRIGDPDVETVLVNRFYLRGVEQVDKRTGLKHQRLPGAPLGGTTWQDRS